MVDKEKIKAALKAQKMDYKTFAVKAGVSLPTITRILGNKPYNTTLETVNRIYAALGLPQNQRDEQMHSPQKIRLLQYIDKMRQDEVVALLMLVESLENLRKQ